ncbi:hypothetical protein [Chondromyces crocatus]|uniref:Uncharacterized protein n=1 Tax=Chondromyces crocatus TaxID=52 RepID=A0A0K1EI76_CHOCO|nr:hypothetical protein [Chondromyces crocatus]AKT40556.1 uncharacterized protein CMC5_047120 [Chondromyces crocatus]
MPDDLRAFYRAHDGVFLSWGLEGRDVTEPLEPFGFPEYGAPPGVVNLLPMAKAFSTNWVHRDLINWPSEAHREIYGVEAQDDEEDDDGPERLRAALLDHYSRYQHTSLVFGPPDQPAWTLIAHDHGADMLSSSLSTFTTYLEVTLARWGTNRMPVYRPVRTRGTATPGVPMIDGPMKHPSLDEIVEDLAKSAAS